MKKIIFGLIFLSIVLPVGAKTKKPAKPNLTGEYSNLLDMGRNTLMLKENMTAELSWSEGESGAAKGKWSVNGKVLQLKIAGSKPTKCKIIQTKELDSVPTDAETGIALKCPDTIGGTLYRKRVVAEPAASESIPQ